MLAVVESFTAARKRGPGTPCETAGALTLPHACISCVCDRSYEESCMTRLFLASSHRLSEIILSTLVIHFTWLTVNLSLLRKSWHIPCVFKI